MTDNTEKKDMNDINRLLMEIQNAAGCPYLSDLHARKQQHSEQSKQLILAIPLDLYLLQDWNEAASYILGQKCHFQTVEEARAIILLAM